MLQSLGNLSDDDIGSLDEAVHDAASAEASEANNGGPSAQVDYLLRRGWTTKEVTELLRGPKTD